jgi:hypothetical protein
MTIGKLNDNQLGALRPLEQQLRRAVCQADSETAVEIATQIQAIFGSDRRHHRLLRAKLWAYEACIDANRLTYAEAGLTGIRKLSAAETRLHLEANALLVVVNLRQKKVVEAKKLIKEVVKNINNIVSPRTRHQFQKRFVERVEEECVLAELIGTGDGRLDTEEIQEKAVLLLKHNSDDEILQFIGNSVPAAGVRLLSDVRDYSLAQLPEPDRKLLPSPEKAQAPKNIGRAAFAVLRRIAWKTFCKEDSPIYKLWSKRIPKVFNEGYFAAAAVAALNDFRIGVPMLGSGLAALTMKYGAEEFCSLAKPKGLMIDRSEKDER